MNEQWERATRRVLLRYGSRATPVRVESLGNRGGFSGAGIWRVETELGHFALRRWPAGELSRERILGLHRLLEHLRAEGVSFVAVPLRDDDGASLHRFDGADWQLEPWLPGNADFHAHPSRERLRSAMAALAQWHLVAPRFGPAADCAKWFSGKSDAPVPAVSERLMRLNQIDDRTLAFMERAVAQASTNRFADFSRCVLDAFRRAYGHVVSELRLMRHVTVPLQPCLRDVWHDHLLFTGDEVTGLIDPSACRTESVASDLARLIGSLVQDDRAEWDFALAEYQRHRPLTTNELGLVAILDRSGVLLSGWTWLEWLHVERRSFDDAAAVERRLSEIAGRMQAVFAGNFPLPIK